jgi:hypothetical protein
VWTQLQEGPRLVTEHLQSHRGAATARKVADERRKGGKDLR